MGFFEKLKQGLTKTRDDFNNKLSQVFSLGRKIDEEFYEDLEETLIQADVGVQTAVELTERLREIEKKEHIREAEPLRQALQTEIVKIIKGSVDGENKNRFLLKGGRLNIILVVGVNGAGKTTTIGKMAAYYHSIGHKVLLAAADTFRAAAREQLAVWGERNQIEVISQDKGDPASVAYESIVSGKKKGMDIVMVDTAGRLPTQTNLMNELSRIQRVQGKAMEGAPHASILVLDGTNGQNALAQVKAFDEAAKLTGLIITKLDGTAKGGVLVALACSRENPIPIYYIGVGETIDDLQTFNADEFAAALVGLDK